MTQFLDRHEQIRLAHAEFIRQVVETCRNPDRRQDLEALLYTADQNGWTALVGALRRIAAGERGPSALAGLDEEDQVIADSMLRGLQDPSTLPDPQAKPDPTLAAPGLAHMIHSAATGNTQALVLISNMAEQMSGVGGSMGRLAAVVRPLINGERDPDCLCKGMDTRTEQLVLSILSELGQLEEH
ncbi:MAG: hypothetical protein U9Q81_00155 [Pseudomonadota bacterium]|nr:hypothetical protein [Pseudomonadota bacterium]